MDSLLTDLSFVFRHLLSPFSLAKWVVRNRKMELAFAFFAILPVSGFILTLLFTKNTNLAVWIGLMLGLILLSLLISWTISATSDRILGKYIPFEYVFCALSSTQLVSVPLILLSMFLGYLGIGAGSVKGGEVFGLFFGWTAVIVAVPALPASFALATLIFAAFGIDQNRLIRAFAIFFAFIAIILSILTAILGRSLLLSLGNTFFSGFLF